MVMRYILVFVPMLTIVIHEVLRFVRVITASMMGILTVGQVMVVILWIVVWTVPTRGEQDLTIRLLLFMYLLNWLFLLVNWCLRSGLLTWLLGCLVMDGSLRRRTHCFRRRRRHLRVGSYVRRWHSM